MSLTFVQQIESVARRIERRRRATAACWAFAAVVTALIGLMLVDWLVGVYHVAGRVVLTALLLAVLVFIYRRGKGAARGGTTPLSVALELERLYPDHRGLLASGLEFSQQKSDDPTAGSFDLRRAAVLRASLAAEAIDLEAAAPRQPLRRAAAAALAALIVVCLPAAIAPQTFATGVARLLNPLSDVQWPRRHDLAFVDPPQLVPIGSDFETVLRDRRGKLPHSVEVEFRTRRQGRWQYQLHSYTAKGDAIEVRRPNVQESFEFRARGGDHKSMPWQRVEAAPAPQVASLHVTAKPPAYTGLLAEPASEPVRIVAGTTLSIHGAASLRVTSAAIQAEGQAAVPLVVGGDGHSFQTPASGWQPETTGEWSFAFTTAAGMTAVADRRLLVEVTPDRPPTVEIVEPTENLAVLPNAQIEIETAADDDLAVKSVRLSATQPNSAEGKRTQIELYEGSAQPAPGQHKISHTLDLASIAPPVGAELQVVAHASDYAGQNGTSVRPLRLRVISRDEFIHRVDALMARLAATLERAMAIQQECRSRVEELLRDSPATGAGTPLSAASLQRQVGQTIAGSPESAVRLAESLVAEYRRNQWPDERALAQIELALSDLNSLTANQLATAGRLLTEFTRAAQHSSPPADGQLIDEQREVLSAVRSRQEAIIESLQAMLRDLAQASEVQQYQRELAELKGEQSDLLKQTEALARDALQNPGEPPTEQKQARQQAVARQRQLAAHLAATLGRMKQSASELRARKPGEAARLDAAVDGAEQSQLRRLVREAADQVAAARFGQAASAQRDAVERLQKTLDHMAEGGDKAADNRLAALKEAERQLDAVRRKVNALLAEQSEGSTQPLAEQTKRIADTLEQLHAEYAARSAQEAAEKLSGGADSAASNASADRKLAEAQQRLAAERRRQQTLLSKLQVERLDAALGRLAAAQQAVVEQAVQLRDRRTQDGGLRPADMPTAVGLAGEQTEVQQKSLAHAEQAEPFPVFARLLRTAADTMQAAATRLNDGDASEEAVGLTNQALDELQMLAAAVRQQRQQQSSPPQPDQPRSQQPNQNEGQKTDPDQAQALQVAVAQLGLLRTLQSELREKTTELERKAANAEIDGDAVQQQSAKLAAEQRELTELAESLVQGLSPPAAEEENPVIE